MEAGMLMINGHLRLRVRQDSHIHTKKARDQVAFRHSKMLSSMLGPGVQKEI
jgi:hypothetical protein